MSTCLPISLPGKDIYEFSVTIRENYALHPGDRTKFKITSTRGVFDHLKALERKGYIKGFSKRALRLSASPEDPLSQMPKKFPSLAGSGPVHRSWLKKISKDFFR
jgi:hypothetical protein